jgi:L-lactate dehydrogenase complex protein LldE
MSINSTSRVALFGTCLVDQFFPAVGLAAIEVLRKCGIRAEFPRGQTCCGQPFFNMGYRNEAREMARRAVELFRGYDAVVLPSGSCAAMIRVHYPDLLPESVSLASRTFELTQFVVRRLGIDRVASRFRGSVALHDGCHALRELRVREEPRRLLDNIPGCEVSELRSCDSCCGFGGTFSVKFGRISAEMARSKCEAIEASGARTVASTDSSCLMQIEGTLRRRGSAIRARHIAEILAE